MIQTGGSFESTADLLARTAPAHRRRRIMALGLTFADHVRETGERADQPVVFAKHAQPLVAPAILQTPSADTLHQALGELDARLARQMSERFPAPPALLDYEIELALLLLDDCRPGLPMPRIAFVLCNDVTARSLQIAGIGAADRLRYWSAAKSLAGFLPLAAQAWVPTTTDEDAWPEVALTTRVNGQVRQRAPMAQILWSPLQTLQWAVDSVPERELFCGDLVLSGTPAGIALQVPGWKRRLADWLPRRTAITLGWRSAMASPLFLQPGDRIEMDAGWLGRFEQQVA